MDNPEIKKFVPIPDKLLQAARELRINMTDVERIMWFCLRRKQLGGFGFRRQHPLKKYVVDFYCSEAKLVLELDGGQHGEPATQASDQARTAVLEQSGITVLRIWNHDVLQNLEGVLSVIHETLIALVDKRRKSPPPP